MRFPVTLLIYCCLTVAAFGQVSVNLIVPAQMPERVPSWTEEMNSQIQVVVTNTSRETFPNLRVSVTITDLDRGRTLLQTKDNDPNMPRFTLNSGGTVTRFARDIINRRAISYDASVERTIMTTNSIPEGSYEFCVSVIDQQGNPITLQDRICRQFMISIPDPPTLIVPANGDSLQADVLPTFQWTPLIGGGTGARVQYRLKVVPVFRGQTPQVALQTNPVLLDKLVQSTTYQYLPTDTRLNSYTGTTGYAWTVQSVRNDNPMISFGRNEGRSELFSFGFAGKRDNGKSPSKKTTIADGLPKNIDRNNFADTSTIPTAMVSGKLVWSFRKSESKKNPTPLTGVSSVAVSVVQGDGVTKQVMVGNKLGTITQQVINDNADAESYPLMNTTVKLYAITGTSVSGTSTKVGSGKNAQYETMIGSGKTDDNGAFSITYIVPTFSLTTSGGFVDAEVQKQAEAIRKKDGEKAMKEYLAKEAEKKGLHANPATDTKTPWKIRVVASGDYSFLYDTPVIEMQGSLAQKKDIGTIKGLARTQRITTEVYDMKGKKLPDSASTIQIFRSSSWRTQQPYTKHEGVLPISVIYTIAGEKCAMIANVTGGTVVPRLFVNQPGSVHDKFYIRVTAKIDKDITLDTVQALYSVDESAIADDAIAVITKRYDVTLKNRSVVRGKVLTPDKSNNDKLMSPGVTPVVLVPYSGIGLADTTSLIKVLSDEVTGGFVFDNVPPGQYYLQVGGAKKYLNTENQGKYGFYGAMLNLFSPKIVDTTIIIENSLSTLVGRLTDDIGNPITGTIEMLNGNSKIVRSTDNDGAFTLAVLYGTNDVHIRSVGHRDTTFTLVVTPEEAFGVPDWVSKEIQDKVKEAVEKAAKGKQYEQEKDPTKKFGWGMRDERAMFESWANSVMGTETMRQTASINGAPLQSYSPRQSGYESGKNSYAGASIKQNNGSLYSESEVGAFGALYMELFSGAAMNGKQKAMGKDAMWERITSESDNNEADIIDVGSLKMTRRTKLRVTVVEVVKGASSSGGKGKFEIKGDATAMVPVENVKLSIEGVNTTSTVSTVTKTTNKNGSAVLENILPGVITVRATATATTYFIPALTDVTVGALKDSSSLLITLEHGGGVSGTVKDDKGNPVANARVRVKGYDELMIEALTNSNGQYTLRGIPQGKQTCMATAEGYIGQAQSRTIVVDSTIKGVDFVIKKSSFTITSIYGFPVEVESYDETNKTITGAFVKIPKNDVFSIDEKIRLPFSKLKVVINNNKALPENSSVDLPLVTDVELRAFGKIPIVVKTLKLHKGSTNESGKFASTTNQAKLDWQKFIPLGTLPWKIANTDDCYLATKESAENMDLFPSDGKSPVTGKTLALKSLKSLNVTLWNTPLTIGLKDATIGEDGIHIKSDETDLPGSDFTKGKNVIIKELHFKTTGAIGAVQVELDAKQTFSVGSAFQFTLSGISITESGISTGGAVTFSVGDMVQAKDIAFSNLILDKDKISGGSFNVNNGAITILKKYSLSTNSANAFGLTLQESGGVYSVTSKQITLGKTKYFDEGFKAAFTVTSKGDVTLNVASNFTANLFNVAKINVAAILLNTAQQTLDVAGSLKLDIPKVASLEGAGFHFKKNGDVDIDKISASINAGPAVLAVKDLAFGENIQKPEIGSGGGKDASAECTWSGFSTDNVAFTVPGTDIGISAGFYYLKCDGKGTAFGAKFNVAGGLVTFPIGPATVTVTGGGFDANTASKEYSISIFSSVSVAGADKVVAFKPTTMTLGLSAGSPFIKASTSVNMFPETEELTKKLGDAVMLMNFGQKYLMVDVSVVDYEVMPGVPVNGSLHIEAQINGGSSYFWAGIQCNVVALGGLINANGAILVGVNVPVDKVQAQYKTAFYDGANTGSFTGITTRVSATFGAPYEKRKCIDVGLCDACVWFGATAEAQLYVDFSKGFTQPAFGFGFNAAWSAGAKCGCVGASAGLGGGLAGGYNKQQHGGWYFSGTVTGEFEFCIGYCVDPDISVSMSYYQNKGFDFSLD